MISNIKTSVFVLTCLALSACGSADHFGKPPSISDLTVDGETMPETRKVSIPMEEPVAEPPMQRADGASLWKKGADGFFGDKRAALIGDILTVNIDIADRAQLSNETERSRSNQKTSGFPTFFGYEKQIAKVLPGLPDGDLPTENVVDIGGESTSTGSGSVNRNETIRLKVAAVIIDRLPNGNLVIAGRQEVRVNFELRELRVAGIIRPEDITMDNSISYEKIAEARIAYGGRGQITDFQQPPLGQQAVDVLMPW